MRKRYTEFQGHVMNRCHLHREMKENFMEQEMFALNKEDEYEFPGQRVEGPALQDYASKEDSEGTFNGNDFGRINRSKTMRDLLITTKKIFDILRAVTVL